MDQWLGQIRHDLRRLEEQHLLRGLRVAEPSGPMVRIERRACVNLASNDYLGLAHHPRLRQAAIAAIEQDGTGAGASRLVVGHRSAHTRVEERFARFKHAAAALLCPTGYMANLAALTALAGPGDLICLDKLNHASLIDAARASGATIRVFPHLDYAKLARLLQRSPRTKGREHRLPEHPSRRFIVTDSVFSMDGDTANLPALCDLADHYDAILVVDEAHATGVLGVTGAGLAELQGVLGRIDVVVSTASKALGGLGGIITAPREVIDWLVNRARSFIYTTAVPPAQAAAIEAALDVVRDEPWRRQRVLSLAARLRQELTRLGSLAPLPAPNDAQPVTPIVPLITGSVERALSLSAHLQTRGFYAPAIRPPTVAPGAARVRLSLRADLEDGMIDRLVKALKTYG
jgi:8-amino-7-oxononanoate synthase